MKTTVDYSFYRNEDEKFVRALQDTTDWFDGTFQRDPDTNVTVEATMFDYIAEGANYNNAMMMLSFAGVEGYPANCFYYSVKDALHTMTQ